jgi:hypothetical protein
MRLMRFEATGSQTGIPCTASFPGHVGLNHAERETRDEATSEI